MSRIKAPVSFLSAIFLMLALIVPSAATPAHEAVLRFSQTESEAVIEIVVPSPEKLTSIDFSVHFETESAVIFEISLEGCDTEATGADVADDIIEEGTEFIYSYENTEKSISFSGYFIDSLSKDDDFILCKIILSEAAAFADSDTAEFSYTLNCELCSKTDTVIYSLKEKAISTDTSLPSYPLGDADSDGAVTASDARTILRASVGLDTLPLSIVAYADSDCDGAISASDARYALRTSVGLEKNIMHRFDISLEEDALCENGGIYTFTCDITGKTFSMEVANGGHILAESDCFSTGNCIVCNNAVNPATGHNFNESGICEACKADKNILEAAEEKLIPLLEEISTYDTLADEALSKNKKSEFLSSSQKATLLIKDACEASDSIIGMEEIHKHLMKAYKIRFDAFVSITDEEGQILANTKNCEVILAAVKASNAHIDYASYLYE